MKDKVTEKINIITITITLIGIILLLGGIGTFIYDQVLEMQSLKVNSIIKSINTNNKGNSATVEYNISGTLYKTEIMIPKNTKLTVSDTITIKVLTKDPKVAINNDHVIQGIVLLVIGGIVVAISIKNSMIIVKEYNRVKKIKSNCMSIKVPIKETFINNNAKQHQGVYPYRLRAVYVNPSNNETYVYESENTFVNLPEKIKLYNANQVTVLIEKNDTKNYYVVLDSLEQNDKYNIVNPIEFVKEKKKEAIEGTEAPAITSEQPKVEEEPKVEEQTPVTEAAPKPVAVPSKPVEPKPTPEPVTEPKEPVAPVPVAPENKPVVPEPKSAPEPVKVSQPKVEEPKPVPTPSKPVETKPVETKPTTEPVKKEETKPVETKPTPEPVKKEETKPAETKPVETKPVEPAKPVETAKEEAPKEPAPNVPEGTKEEVKAVSSKPALDTTKEVKSVESESKVEDNKN